MARGQRALLPSDSLADLDFHLSPLSHQASHSLLHYDRPYAALITTTPRSTLLQAKWRAVFLFSSNTVRSAFPRYSRNSTKERGQRRTDAPHSHLQQQPSQLSNLYVYTLHPTCKEKVKHPKTCYLLPKPHRQG